MAPKLLYTVIISIEITDGPVISSHILDKSTFVLSSDLVYLVFFCDMNQVSSWDTGGPRCSELTTKMRILQNDCILF